MCCYVTELHAYDFVIKDFAVKIGGVTCAGPHIQQNAVVISDTVSSGSELGTRSSVGSPGTLCAVSVMTATVHLPF